MESLQFYYNNVTTDRKWELIFQSKPIAKVIATGDEPTTEEIIEVLGSNSCPAWMIPVIKLLWLVHATPDASQK